MSNLTKNEIFKKICQLTGLSSDLITLEKILINQGLIFGNNPKSSLKNWMRLPSDPKFTVIPDDVFRIFLDALFSIRTKADEKGFSIFDCRNIFEDL